MNLRSLINFNESLNTAIGVNVHATDSSGISISYCVIKKEGSLLSIIEHHAGINSIGKLQEKLANLSKIAVRTHVNFSGKGLLMKALEERDMNTSNAVVQKLFPFIPKEDMASQFYNHAAGS